MDNNETYINECPEVIISEKYYDLLIEYGGQLSRITDNFTPSCIQIINDKYAVFHGLLSELQYNPVAFSPYLLSPLKLRGPALSTLDLSAIEESGILPLFTQPFLQLRGKDVIIAIIDSGIDYTHPAFVYEDNTTKILSIWDQTIVGIPPDGLAFGTEYTSEQINLALSSPNPLLVVPSMDEVGHGTFIAGIAAGRTITSSNFSGAAPDSDLIIVKLKNAKEYLRNANMLNPSVIAYAASDYMLAVKFVVEKATLLDRRLVICVSLGTNLGGHDGSTVLETYLNLISTNRSICIVIAAGNELTLSRHTSFNFSEAAPTVNINLRVGPGETGFLLNIWGKSPDSLSVGIVTPSGETVRQLPARLGQRDTISFILEPTTIIIEYFMFENSSGDPLISLRFTNPSEGIWTIRLVRIAGVNQAVHMWLPCCDWVSSNTYFIQPTSNTTITVPSSATLPICVGGYNHRTNSMYINSSHGFTRNNVIKPDFVAPAVNILGPLPNNTYGVLSGTSIAAAITSGAAALLYQWGGTRADTHVDTTKIKSLIIKGAIRNPNRSYPNEESGYGILNLANTFETLRSPD